MPKLHTCCVSARQQQKRYERLQKRRKCQQESIRRLEELPSDALVHTSEPRQCDRDTQTDSPLRTNRSQQTDCDPLNYELQNLREELHKAKRELAACKFGFGLVEGDDKKTHYYTGLASWALFLHVFNFLSSHVKHSRRVMTPMDQFFLVLVKLRLDLHFQDMAYRFAVSLGTITNIFHEWLEIMSMRLKFLIMWPSREILSENMPQVFKDLYPRARCIIDCSEVFTERPTSFQARAKTYSNYKKHNTVKFLIATTPSGTISFISRCWGGRVSDKYITQHSDFLHRIEPGDMVLADRGFNIAEDLALYGAKLEIPAFTKGKKQLSQEEVEYSQRLAKVRIHVERVIGLMKKYTILQSVLPVSLIKHTGDEDYATIDRILTVCASLTNLSPVILH